MNRWEILIDIINSEGYKNIAEIGVHHGKTARKIIDACELDRYLMVDPFVCAALFGYLEGRPCVEYWITTSEEAQKTVADNSFDLVFLDALHQKHNVLNDIRWWMPKIREGGILCGDDYNQVHCEGVKEAVDEVFGDAVELRDIGKKGVKLWIFKV